MDTQRDGIPGRQYAPLRPGDDGHRKLLFQKLKLYKDSSGATYGKIAQGVMDLLKNDEGKSVEAPWKEAYLRKFMSDPENLKPSGHQMNTMYRFLDEKGAWDHRVAKRNQVSEIEDAAYFCLLEFFDVAEMTTTNLLRRLPGIYRIYRPVLTHPKHFVVGAVRLWSDMDRGILRYEEYNAIQRMNGREAKHVTLKGYAFKKSNFVSLFASDSSKSSIHITTFTSCEIQDDQYIILFGGFFDTLGKQMYSGRVFMERIQNISDDEETFNRLKADSRCIHKRQVPPSIAGFFDRPGETDDIGLF
ncbi:MAG: hypothetical protein KJ731_01895 [Alphaproteobacteria bacterium]|nr:hypothetical protein [Alphaproteobacteria bacterium]MBU1280591.1 hypothetical protein [Alphaproteobacteria bacterium]MBU1574478.1 hypothetical protein [Alphaproteobacteria bacterium]MBU1827221.1 hypothetical protein [Alphaproteobacteria bacterium]MBU2078831.1 hypothetical protein [Alphaproteobacteria bacterium]